jgi:hypothetical protein
MPEHSALLGCVDLLGQCIREADSSFQDGDEVVGVDEDEVVPRSSGDTQ